MTAKRGDIMERSSADPTSYDGYPQWLKDRLDWFQDLKFGLFMHWGPYCQWGCIESWPLVEVDTWARPDNLAPWVERDKDIERFKRDYWALNTTFDPVDFDPVPWAEAADRAGMKYVCFTTKHHDGFCMFDTVTTEYRITHPDCPFHSDTRANIAKIVFDTFRERGFATSCYFSKSDWSSPYYWWPGAPAPTRNPNYDTHAHPERWEQFVQYVHAQIRELMTDYGHMDLLWLDGGQVRSPNQDIRMAEIAEFARKLQPGLIIADRTVGNEFENIKTPEQRIPEKPLNEPWESCLTMGNGWAYRPNDVYKSTRELLHMLIDIVAKGGNFLLNIGPNPMGTFDAEPMNRLQEIGDWMDINSDAIHGTRPIAPYKEGNVCFTAKDDKVYAIIMGEEGEAVPSREIVLRNLAPAEGDRVKMLGVAAPIPAVYGLDGVTLQLPIGRLPCEHAWVLEFPNRES